MYKVEDRQLNNGQFEKHQKSESCNLEIGKFENWKFVNLKC